MIACRTCRSENMHGDAEKEEDDADDNNESDGNDDEVSDNND